MLLSLFILPLFTSAVLSQGATYISDNVSLPDFRPDSEHLQRTLYIDYMDASSDMCLINEGCFSGDGKRKLLKFGTKVHNVGTKDAYLGQPPAERYGNDIPAYWHWDTCHKHWHFTAYANYRLLDSNRTKVVLTGHKNGFCLEDLGCTVEGSSPKYNCGNQGVTVGCYDLYDETLPCQWIDITDLEKEPDYTPSTVYWLEVIVNEQGFFPELSIDNNRAYAKVVIERVPKYDGPGLDEVEAPNGPGEPSTTGTQAPPAVVWETVYVTVEA
ncbi:Lysyl oxidase 3 [Gaertneriomyces sp. JEL0708]|nr:Lysyl oxidase 3 [Gaertneriomyces sp. JEL0708]